MFGDTTDYAAGKQDDLNPIIACRLLDENVTKQYFRDYEIVNSLASNETGYFVYQADINGGYTVTTVDDRENSETIKSIHCKLIAIVRCFDSYMDN